ncbi:hypothetical protein CDO52_13025 [Nocardiopsis gilva YIM 90087]|uniref:Holin n=1 Tax=Nocardiopsis gilva YIM 90087 TaxID=1235441 RepID=A0A223S664_9ACTN|nr:hypothetical protein [Nocardiopsis gilva]ASU83592.1 hypothetical protein CDO52_13025 [Nocardiopsis gilva YIM 90087]
MPATLETKTDAKDRSLRTVLQNALAGVVSVVLVAAAGAVADTLTAGEAVDWPTLSAVVGTAVLGAVVAYAQRRLEGARKDRSR